MARCGPRSCRRRSRPGAENRRGRGGVRNSFRGAGLGPGNREVSPLRLDCGACVVRSWEPSDAPALTLHANDRSVWENLRDRFPHPYTELDARTFIRARRAARPATNFAIDVGGDSIGAIGIIPGHDVERVGAEIGYWVSRLLRGRGIATDALRGFTAWAFEEFRLERIFAVPFLRNAASCRVLAKAGD